jgi:hypothetical protein
LLGLKVIVTSCSDLGTSLVLAVLYEQGRAIYEMNLANLSDEQEIEAKEDYRIGARRGRAEQVKPKKKRHKINRDNT